MSDSNRCSKTNEQREIVARLDEMISLQRENNQLLAVLCEMLAEDIDGEEPPATHYLDGSPLSAR